jgi:hypothetical protein
MMHRTHAAGLLAVALPGALSIHWLLGIPIAVGLWRTRAWTAWGAAGLGVAMLWPWTLAVSGGAALLVAATSWGAWTTNRRVVRARGSFSERWMPHGAGLDGLRARLVSWAYLCRTWSWRGGDTRLALEAASIRSGGVAMEGGPARNELVQLAYSYGLAGVVGVLVVLIGACWFIRVGEPFSAMLAAGLVVCSGTAPLTALRRWLTGGDGPLFGPPLRASLSLHLDAKGMIHLYGAETADHALQVEIAWMLANAANGWMQQHNVTLEEIARP